MTQVGTRDIPPLNWDVLVTPGIPIATSEYNGLTNYTIIVSSLAVLNQIINLVHGNLITQDILNIKIIFSIQYNGIVVELIKRHE